MGRAQQRRQRFDNDNASSGYRDRKSKKARTNVREREGYGSYVPAQSTKKFDPWNDKQRVYAATIKASVCTIAIGPAGTAKTHVAIASNVDFLQASHLNKMVLTNPAVEIGSELGTLPGDKDEKIAVSVRPMRDILNKVLGASTVEQYVKDQKVLFEPLGSILGTTFDNALILLDEAQNATPAQIKALLTRVGKNSKIVLAGDFLEQKFIDGPSGLQDALHRLRHLPGVSVVEFTVDDIVRSDFCKAVITAYRETEEAPIQ